MPQTSTGISPSELLMERKVHTRFDLTHPDIAKQDKMIKLFTRAYTFKVGDRLYAGGFMGPHIWIPVTITEVIRPLLYQV